MKFNPLTGKFDISDKTKPAGSTTEVQFNSSGVFGASSKLTWNDTDKTLTQQASNSLSTLGSDVVTNGDFETMALTPWAGTYWEINNDAVKGYLAKHKTGRSNVMTQTATLTEGALYKATYTIVQLSGTTLAGTVSIKINGTNGAANSVAGTYTEYLTAGSSGGIQFQPLSTFNGGIDDVSVKLLSSITPVRVLKDADGDIRWEERVVDGSTDWNPNFYMGKEAGQYVSASAEGNIGIGYQALKYNTSGGNFALGNRTLINNQGQYNFALGFVTLNVNTTGQQNCGVGNNVMQSNTTGSYNTAIGTGCLNLSVSGSYNVAIGNGAGQDGTRSSCVCIGFESGKSDTTSNRLHIDCTDRSDSLIYGKFDDRLVKINGDLEILDAKNIKFNATTGTKIGSASTEKLSLWGVTPIVQPTTSAYTSDSESSAYTGIDNAQAGTVYAQLADLNALRTAYETLRTSYDDLLTKLKTTGIVV